MDGRSVAGVFAGFSGLIGLHRSVRRKLHESGYVWKRFRCTLEPDPDLEEKRRIRSRIVKRSSSAPNEMPLRQPGHSGLLNWFGSWMMVVFSITEASFQGGERWRGGMN